MSPSMLRAGMWVWLLLMLVVLTATVSAAEGRHPMVERAEGRFFETFNTNPEQPTAALKDLLTAYVIAPNDARTNLLLGLNHLWLAAEGDRQDLQTIEHLYLAEHFLTRSQELDPTDVRIHSWLLPARIGLARIEQDPARAADLRRQMLEAYETDPNFHSLVVGLLTFDEPRGSQGFRRGLEVMRLAGSCVGSDDPTCLNRPAWPHNLEGFLVFLADFELKAGESKRARAVLEQVRAIPDFKTWPYQQAVADRLEQLDDLARRYANEDPEDDSPNFFEASNALSCQGCHRTR